MPDFEADTPSTCREIWLMIRLALPSAVINGLRMGQMLTDQAVIGHLRSRSGHATPVYLDAASLALLWMTLTLSVVKRGLTNSITMLVSQARGAGNGHLADTWLLTGALIAIPGTAVLSGLWLCTGQIVGIFAHNQSIGHGAGHAMVLVDHETPGTIFGQLSLPPATFTAASTSSVASSGPLGVVGDPVDGVGDPVHLASLYARLAIGCILPTLWMESLHSWLLAQRIVRPQLVVYALALGLNLFLNVFLVNGLGGYGGYGFTGSPLATTATRVIQLFALIAALPLARIAWPRPRLAEAIRPHRLRVFSAQFVPRMLSCLLEEVALQTIGALAGRLDAIDSATHNAMLMTFFWLTSPMYGVGTATQQRLGYHLGAGNHKGAKKVAWICLGLAEAIALIVAGTMIAIRHEIGKLFSNDIRVVDTVAAIVPLVATTYCLVGFFYAGMAVLGGQGRPQPVALAFFLGAFLIAPASGYVLTFVVHCACTHRVARECRPTLAVHAPRQHGWQTPLSPSRACNMSCVPAGCGGVLLYGLWFGLIGGYSVTTLISGIAVCRSNWPLIAKQAQERSEILPGALSGASHGQSDGGAGGASSSWSVNQPDRAQGEASTASSRLAAPLLQNGTDARPEVLASTPRRGVPPVPQLPISRSAAELWAEAD